MGDLVAVSIDSVELANLRDMMKHEAEQANRRISWLGTIQGFLFAAWGVTTRSGLTARPLRVIEVLGLTVALLVFIGTSASATALLRINKLWLKQRPQDYGGIGPFGFFPERATLIVLTYPEVLMPLVFVLAWIAILRMG